MFSCLFTGAMISLPFVTVNEFLFRNPELDGVPVRAGAQMAPTRRSVSRPAWDSPKGIAFCFLSGSVRA